MFDVSLGRARPSIRRRVTRAVVGLAVAAGVVTTGGPAADAQAACSDVEIVTARGTWEPQDAAYLLPQVTDRIEDGLSGTSVSVYDVQYPAQPWFNVSAPEGVTDLVEHLNAQAAECPDQRFVLLGYSQGALVTGDAVVDPSGRAYTQSTPTLSADATSRIEAIGMYGSMRFTGGEPFNAGDHDPGLSSTLPREPGALSAYADRTIDYCYLEDWVCQDTGSFITHLGYIFDPAAQQEVADFVVDQVQS